MPHPLAPLMAMCIGFAVGRLLEQLILYLMG